MVLVLLLGAGASCDTGLPLGDDAAEQIAYSLFTARPVLCHSICHRSEADAPDSLVKNKRGNT